MGRAKTKKFALDFGPIIELVGWREVLRQVGLKPLIEEVGLKPMIEEVGLQRLVSELTPQQRRELQRLLGETPQHGR
jgi:hypothetical protein